MLLLASILIGSAFLQLTLGFYPAYQNNYSYGWPKLRHHQQPYTPKCVNPWRFFNFCRFWCWNQNCCQYSGKPGSCPKPTYFARYYFPQSCMYDFQCPQHYKCCSDIYGYKFCTPPVFPIGSATEKPETTTEIEEATTTEEVYTTEEEESTTEEEDTTTTEFITTTTEDTTTITEAIEYPSANYAINNSEEEIIIDLESESEESIEETTNQEVTEDIKNVTEPVTVEETVVTEIEEKSTAGPIDGDLEEATTTEEASTTEEEASTTEEEDTTTTEYITTTTEFITTTTEDTTTITEAIEYTEEEIIIDSESETEESIEETTNQEVTEDIKNVTEPVTVEETVVTEIEEKTTVGPIDGDLEGSASGFEPQSDDEDYMFVLDK